MRKFLRFRKKYKDSKRAYPVGKVGEFEGEFAKMLIRMKYAVEIDSDKNDMIKVSEYSKKKLNIKKGGESG